MQIDFLGAAQTVTGSMHLVRTGGSQILLDCGLYQGRRLEAYERNKSMPARLVGVDAVVLSHAHIDHSGALPLLYRQGYRGPIYMTPATRDLVTAMLHDAAMIQQSDARYINRAIAWRHVPMQEVEPLYDAGDVVGVSAQFVSVPYGKQQRLTDDVELRFVDAGHVLGSAIAILDVAEARRKTRLVFSGDLGRVGMPMLRDPEVPSGAHLLLLESTYGNRQHPPLAESDDALAEVIARVHARKGKIIIPSFALERAQEILLACWRLRRAGRLAPMPIYVDSPLTVKLTEVFRRHPECFDPETRAILNGPGSPFDMPDLHYVTEVDDSKALDASLQPAIIIAASGMCEGGRVLHHLRGTIEDERNAVVIVGFQAQHTLGRRIAERRAEVKIFGLMHPLRAEVAVLAGYSAHAGSDELVAFAEGCREKGALEKVILVHGEREAQDALARALTERGFAPPLIPAQGEVARFA